MSILYLVLNLQKCYISEMCVCSQYKTSFYKGMDLIEDLFRKTIQKFRWIYYHMNGFSFN